MKVGICVHYTSDWLPLINVTLPILEEYCNRHNYDLSVNEVMQYGQYTGYDKLHQAYEHLQLNDVVMVMDADTLITNLTIKVEDIIDDNHDFFISEDYNGINAGVFIIKKTDWGRHFLNHLLHFVWHRDYDVHCEQDVIRNYIKAVGLKHIAIIPQNKINSYLYENYPEIGKLTIDNGQWHKGSFILHLPGLPINKRIEIFSEIKDKIVYG